MIFFMNQYFFSNMGYSKEVWIVSKNFTTLVMRGLVSVHGIL